MKILLINPPFKTEFGCFSRTSRSPAVAKSGTLYYPFWLSYTTGVLEKAGFETELIDAPAERYTEEDVLEMAISFNPKLVVLDTSTPSIYSDVEFGSKIKTKIKNSFVLLVGTHPSVLPEETLNLNKSIDGIAIGEYDYTVRDLAYAIKNTSDLKSVRGIVYRDGERLIFNEKRAYIENLDEIPFVSSVYKKHLNYKNYFESMARYPMIMIITGRGCPFKCFFCVYPQTFHGNKYRLRSPENVVDEFEYIIENFPDVKEIGIEDDTFTANIKRVKAICELLIKKGINKKIKWWANARVNLDLDTMKLMKAAGCRLIIPGFESGVQSILNNMNKGITIEQSFQFVKNAKKAKLLVHGCFMFGNPGETQQTMVETLEFAKKLALDTAQFYPLIPYPGTKAYAWALENGYLKTKNYSQWLTDDGLHNTVIAFPNLTDKNLVEFCNYARRSFYLRSSYILRKGIQSIFSIEEAKRNIKSFRTFSRYLFRKQAQLNGR